MRVLYSFPHKLGADRICTTAWHQACGVAKAGAAVIVFAGAVTRALPPTITVRPTLARGPFRIPYSLLGRLRALALHDYIVARRLLRLAGQVDIVHTWPLGAIRTLRTAARLGIPAVLERPNTHTRFAYEVVGTECRRLDVALPPDHEHAYNDAVLRIEETEYAIATTLLCPSDFVARTFLERGFPPHKLARHQYGFDDRVYYPDPAPRPDAMGLRMLFVGGCTPRKGLHYALQAWLKSPASQQGRFLIAGDFVAGYAERLSGMLDHPSVHVLGHRTDVPQLMRQSDILILPSIEEGSALVTSEARGSGCVILVSEAAGAVCRHLENALVHRVGDVQALAHHITRLHGDRPFLRQLRAASLRTANDVTWTAAGARLLDVYRGVVAASGYAPLTAGASARAVSPRSR